MMGPAPDWMAWSMLAADVIFGVVGLLLIRRHCRHQTEVEEA